MPAAIAIPAIIGAAGVGATVYGATKQSGAVKDASQLQAESADKALDFQKQQYADQRADQQPYLQEGKSALEQLAKLTGTDGSLLAPYGKTFEFAPFSAPTGVDESNDPGYAFRLAEGQKALERSQAAKGINGGAALKAAERYGQDYASNEYGNVYSRALQNYATNFGTALTGFNTNYGVFQNDQANQFNRLASLAGIGQTATGQIGNSGTATAGNVAAILGNEGNALSNLATQGGNVAASGAIGASNAIGSALSGYQNYQLLQQILNQNRSGYGSPGAGGGGVDPALLGGY